MSEEQIKAHWEIFEDWYKKVYKVRYMPSGALLIIGWYEYCAAWNAMLGCKREPLVLEEKDTPD